MIQRRYFAIGLIVTLWLCGCDSSETQNANPDSSVQSGSPVFGGWSTGGYGTGARPGSEAGTHAGQLGGIGAVSGAGAAVSGAGAAVSGGGTAVSGGVGPAGGESSDASTNSGTAMTIDAASDGSSSPSGIDIGVNTNFKIDCSMVSDIAVDILENEIALEGQAVSKTVQTVLVVRWTQNRTTDSVWLRFTFEKDEWFESPTKSGTLGPHRELILGVPGETDVTIQIMSQTANEKVACQTQGKTGAVPRSVPRATVLSYDPSLASSNRWMLGSVEDTPRVNSRYAGPFCIYIIDRQGRIVWYYLDQAWNPAMAYPRIAPNGTHVLIDRSIRNGTNTPSVIKTTLDFAYFEEYVTRELTDSMDVAADGAILYNSLQWLIEQQPNGTTRNVWSCEQWAAQTGANMIDPRRHCYSNAVTWNPQGDTVILSFPYVNTVVEIDRKTGNLIGQWGDLPGSWRFDPPNRRIDFVHGGNITPNDSLLVSSHAPGSGETETPVPHFFYEFALDRVNRVATEIWSYGEGVAEWPRWKGEAFHVPGDNTLVNYGTGGVIKEITPGGEIAWHVKWDADFPDDSINKMLGHSILIDDLYALCEGW